MPALPYIVAGGLGFGAGLWASSATEGLGSAVKWVAIAGVAYLGAKALKII